MDRVFESNAAGSPPSAPASPSMGYPTAGNPQTAIPATKPGPWWYHMVTEELRALVAAAGLTPSHTTLTQVRDAIQSMIVGAQKAIVTDGATFEASVATGEVVRWDSANSRYDEALADGTANNLAVGIADVAGGKVYLHGKCPLFSGLTPGARYYLSATTPGALTTTPPADAVQIGTAITDTEMFVDIDAATAADAASILAFRDLSLSTTGTNANVTVTAAEIVLADATNVYVTARPVNLTINTAVSGANGLDTGVIAASTWYSVWVIRKADGTMAGLVSLSAAAPTLPSGYTYKARVGWIRTDSSANKYPMSYLQRGNRANYKVAAGSNVVGLPIAASGTAGSITTPTWVAIGVSSLVPPTAESIMIALNNWSGTAMAAPSGSYGSYNSTSNPPPMVCAGLGLMLGDILLESTNIYWASNVASSLVAVIGWEDKL